jgi:hypothetical protein
MEDFAEERRWSANRQKTTSVSGNCLSGKQGCEAIN